MPGIAAHCRSPTVLLSSVSPAPLPPPRLCHLRVHFNRLVGTASNKPGARAVKCGTEHALRERERRFVSVTSHGVSQGCMGMGAPPGPPACGWHLQTHCFGIERSGLRNVLHVLERQARRVIPHGQCAVISWGRHVSTGKRRVRYFWVSDRRHSPPENMTPSSLTESVLIMASWPVKLLTKIPSGHFHFLMLAGQWAVGQSNHSLVGS